jgi:hypothetical protein
VLRVVAAVTAAVAAIGSAVGGTTGAFLIMNATAVATVTVVASSLAVGNHQRRKARAAGRDAYNASLQDRLVMTSTTSGARSRCYGRVRNVDGVLFKATRGTNKEFYTLFIAVAGHEIDAFEGVYFGDVLVTLDGNGYVQDEPYNLAKKTSRSANITLDGSGNGSTTASGTIVASSAGGVQSASESVDAMALTATVSGSVISVTGGTPLAAATITWQESSSTSNARVRYYTGAPGQDVSSVLQPLFPSLITSGQHRFAGIAGLLVDLEYQPDSFPSGVPNISAVFRGAKVYDPRTATTAWTENPALIARDWALYANGGACASGDLVAASFTNAANACDTVQAFTTAAGTQNLALYTCGIVCRTEDDPWQTFGEIVESMAGKAAWAGGQLRVSAGTYRAPVATITEDWLSGKESVQIVPEPPTDEAVNIYRTTIADKAQGYVSVPAPELRAASYISADGRELPREVTLGGVTDTAHAQHISGVLMRDARNGLTVVLPCNLRAFQVEVFDVVSVTLARFGWSAKTFEVLGWQFSLSGGVILTLKETAAAIFQPDSLFLDLDVTPNTQLPTPWVVPLVTGLSVTTSVVSLDDGQPIIRALAQWDAIADAGVATTGRIELQYLLIGLKDAPVTWVNGSAVPVTWSGSGGAAANWNSQQQTDPSGEGWQTVRVLGSQTEAVITGLSQRAAYIFRARAENSLGVRSPWGVQKLVITNSITLPGSVQVETWFAAGGAIGFSSYA